MSVISFPTSARKRVWSRTMLLAGVLALSLGSVRSVQAQYYGDEYYNQGLDLCRAGRYREAIPYLSKAISMDGRNYDAYSERGIALAKLGDDDAAIADYNQEIRMNPSSVGYYNRAISWRNKNEIDKAIEDYDRAIRLDSRSAAAFTNRGSCWASKQDYDKAIANYNQAIRIDPQDKFAYAKRASYWAVKGDYEKAVANYEYQIRLNPSNSFAYNGLAWIQATCPDNKFRDGKKAFRNASKAYQLTADGDYVDTLAAAYAESGDFAKAKEWQAKAISMQTDAEILREFRARLALYEEGKPYRQSDPKQVSVATAE